MKPIDFPQRNLMLAEDQPEYEMLPVNVERKVVETNTGSHNVPWAMTAVYELSDDEIAEIVANRKLFYRQYLFGKSFQPIFISTKDPFIPENKEHWPAGL